MLLREKSCSRESGRGYRLLRLERRCTAVSPPQHAPSLTMNPALGMLPCLLQCRMALLPNRCLLPHLPHIFQLFIRTQPPMPFHLLLSLACQSWFFFSWIRIIACVLWVSPDATTTTVWLGPCWGAQHLSITIWNWWNHEEIFLSPELWPIRKHLSLTWTHHTWADELWNEPLQSKITFLFLHVWNTLEIIS